MKTLKIYKDSAILISAILIFIISGSIMVQADERMKFTLIKNNVEYSGAVIQDRDGFIWLGSVQGLIRYDGIEFKKFSSGPGSISDNRVYALLEDKDEIIWIATGTGGLNKYDKETGSFFSYTYDPNDAGSLSSDRFNMTPNTLLEDSEGLIWIGTSNGLNRFDKKRGTFTRYMYEPHNPNSLSDNSITSIFEDSEGYIWIV